MRNNKKYIYGKNYLINGLINVLMNQYMILTISLLLQALSIISEGVYKKIITYSSDSLLDLNNPIDKDLILGPLLLILISIYILIKSRNILYKLTLLTINKLQMLNVILIIIVLFEIYINNLHDRIWTLIMIIFIIYNYDYVNIIIPIGKQITLKAILQLYFIIRLQFQEQNSYWQIIPSLFIALLLQSINVKQFIVESTTLPQISTAKNEDKTNYIREDSMISKQIHLFHDQFTKLLQSNINFFENIKDMIQLGIALFDSSGQVIFCNTQLLEYLQIHNDYEIIEVFKRTIISDNKELQLKQEINKSDDIKSINQIQQDAILNDSESQQQKQFKLQEKNDKSEFSCDQSKEVPKYIGENKDQVEHVAAGLDNEKLSSNNLMQSFQQISQKNVNKSNNDESIAKFNYFFNKSMSNVQYRHFRNKIYIINIERQKFKINQQTLQDYKNPKNSIYQIIQMLLKKPNQSEQSNSNIKENEQEPMMQQQISQNSIYSKNLNDDAVSINEQEVLINKVINSKILQFKLSMCNYNYLNIETSQILNDQAIFIACQDITQNVEAQQFNQMNSFKMKIIASISHKLKTPLNCSLNLLQQLVQEEQLNQDIEKKFIIPALNSNQLLNSYINDICDYAALEMNTFYLETCHFNLKQTINECVIIFQDQLSIKQIQIKLSYDEEIPSTICSDDKRVRQIIINLLSNAIKYQNNGQILISAKNELDGYIQIQIIDQGKGMSKQQVDSIFKAWNSIQSNTNDYTQMRGAGIGLTISARLVNKLSNNKKIILESNQCQGSSFKFYIKNINKPKRKTIQIQENQNSPNHAEQLLTFHSQVSDASKNVQNYQTIKSINSYQSPNLACNIESGSECDNFSQTVMQSQFKFPDNFNPDKLSFDLNSNSLGLQENSPQQIFINNCVLNQFDRVQDIKDIAENCQCPKILIVDDESYNIYVMKILLQTYSYKCDSAENGNQALKIIKKKFEQSKCCKSYLLIFMDIDLPDKNGYEVTKEIIEFYNQQQKINIEQLIVPFICACSAYVGEDDKLKAKQSGMNHFIEKPVNKEKLYSFIKTIII